MTMNRTATLVGLTILLSGCGKEFDPLRERRYEAMPSDGGIYVVDQDAGAVMYCVVEVAKREIINPYISIDPPAREAIPPKKSPPVEPGTPLFKCSVANFIGSQVIDWSDLPEAKQPTTDELLDKYAGDSDEECEVEEVKKIGGATIRFCKEKGS